MADTRQETCEQRIGAHYASRDEDYETLFAAAGGETVECSACAGTGEIPVEGEEPDECGQCDGTGSTSPEYDGEKIDEDQAYERLIEYPLGVDVKRVMRVMRVQLSTGGPGDWLEVTYHFNDWFDHAERSVSQGSALWRAAEYYAEYVR